MDDFEIDTGTTNAELEAERRRLIQTVRADNAERLAELAAGDILRRPIEHPTDRARREISEREARWEFERRRKAADATHDADNDLGAALAATAKALAALDGRVAALEAAAAAPPKVFETDAVDQRLTQLRDLVERFEQSAREFGAQRDRFQDVADVVVDLPAARRN